MAREEIPTFLADLSYARQMIVFFARKRESIFHGLFFSSRVRKREKKLVIFGVFLVFFLCFFFVYFFCVSVLFGGTFFCFSRVSAKFLGGLFFALSQAKPGISSLVVAFGARSDVRMMVNETQTRVMHGSEIQAKYGNGAWQNMHVWVCGKYYAPRKIPRTPEIWKFYEAQLRTYFRMEV